jgi:hypothetical protein
VTAPRPPASEHLDLDELADVLAGERADDPHLPGCGTCQERLSELAQAQARVAAALAALPEPVLPEALEQRLTAALRDAAGPEPTGAAPPAGAGTPDGRAASRGASVTPLPQRSRRAWVPAAAASLVLVLGGGLGYALLSSSGTGAGDASTSAAGGAAQTESAQSESGQSESGQSESGQSESGQSESGQSESGQSESAQSESAQDSARSEASAPSAAADGSAGTLAVAPPPRSATGADYADEQQRAAALPRVLAGPDPAELPRSAGPLARLRDPAALSACLSAVTAGSGVAPLALDEAVFSGAPALAVVLPSSDPAEVVVHVVGPACDGDDPDTLLVVPVARP